MKVIKIASCILIIFSEVTFSQNSEVISLDPNIVFIELSDFSQILSFNYEHSFPIKNTLTFISPRIGFGNSLSKEDAKLFKILCKIGMNVHYGRRFNFFQASFIRTFYPYHYKIQYPDISNFSIGLGYERRSLQGYYFQFMFYYQMFDVDQFFMGDIRKSWVWPGLGIGYSF